MSNDFIIVVSGLPRSGTSLMMQMLQAGGVPVLVDSPMKINDNNPRGFFEYKKVDRLPLDTAWLSEAIGKAIKIVTPIFIRTPKVYNFKVIMMKRDKKEVQKSLQKMAGKTKPDYILDQMEKMALFHEKALGFEDDLLQVEFAEVISDPLTVANSIKLFLGIDLNIQAMVNAVDPNLYRTRDEDEGDSPQS